MSLLTAIQSFLLLVFLMFLLCTKWLAPPNKCINSWVINVIEETEEHRPKKVTCYNPLEDCRLAKQWQLVHRKHLPRRPEDASYRSALMPCNTGRYQEGWKLRGCNNWHSTVLSLKYSKCFLYRRREHSVKSVWSNEKSRANCSLFKKFSSFTPVSPNTSVDVLLTGKIHLRKNTQKQKQTFQL